jgi:MoxR-like ATPase
MNPQALANYLDGLVRHRIMLSTMIWGPPGIGKSSVVAQTAGAHGLGFIDVRLSQLAPTDLRGLPVPENGISRWYPPEFLLRDGAGILFLDELNLASPTMQGMAQQLILEHSVCVYLTDGYGDFPAEPPDLPVLWVVTPGGRALETFPFGEAVRLLETSAPGI